MSHNSDYQKEKPTKKLTCDKYVTKMKNLTLFQSVFFKCKDTHFFNFANHFPKNRPRTHIALPKRATATDKIIFRDFRF